MKSNWKDHLLNFVAVILGVSLAFVITARSEQAKVEREFSLSAKAILDEVNDDIRTFEEYQIPDNKEKLKQMQIGVDLLSKGIASDSLRPYMMSFFDINNYAPTNIYLSSLISSGKLDLINDFTLKSMLLNYHNFSDELLAQGDFQVDYLMDRILPWYIDHPEFLTDQFYDGREIDETDVLEASIIFTFYLSFVDGKIAKYEEALEQGKYLKDRLEQYNKIEE